MAINQHFILRGAVRDLDNGWGALALKSLRITGPDSCLKKKKKRSTVSSFLNGCKMAELMPDWFLESAGKL